MTKERYHFGEKLREIREKKSLTMREVAERIGLSESLISQIERNKISPAIDTLLAIVEVLDIDIEYLFADLKKERDVELVRRDERRRTVTKSAIYEKLSATSDASDEHGIEAYMLELPVGSERGNTEYGHVGKELGLVIEGSAEFRIGSKSYVLSQGDSISFSSDVPHLLKNTGKTPLKAFWVVTPPKGEL